MGMMTYNDNKDSQILCGENAALFLIRDGAEKKIPRAPAGNVGVNGALTPGAERGRVAEIVFLSLRL